MVHELKLKDLLSSTCQVSSERIMLDLESEVMRGPGSMPTGGNIFHWIILFSRSKASDANIGIIANFALLRKTPMSCNYDWMKSSSLPSMTIYLDLLVKL